MNTESIVLENHRLRTVVMPSFGGKIASLFYKQNQFELLFQNPKPQFTHAPLYADFSEFEACGFDDAFPCINGEELDIGGEKVIYPDHGEIWTASFDYFIKNEKLFLAYKSRILDYEYHKTVYLNDNSLVCEYTIKNNGSLPFPCIWAAHCLVRYEQAMTLLYPRGTRAIEILADSLAPGAAGKKYHFPADTVEGRRRNFTMPPGAAPPYAQKYYIADPIPEGCCGYVYPSQNMRAELFFDAAVLPYLGFWITSGGFCGDYNCAFEPSTGYYDRVSTAKAAGRLDYLDPGKAKTFSLIITITEQKEKN
jgi:galactose mutarotase-like enzyme